MRPARAGDLEALTALMRAYAYDFYGAPPLPDARLHALIGMLLEGEQGTQFVAERDARLVGFATLYFPWSTLSASRTCLMNDLFVAGEARGSGAAAALFEACRRHAREHGHPALWWQTARDNHRARAFYARMGGRVDPWVSYSIPSS